MLYDLQNWATTVATGPFLSFFVAVLLTLLFLFFWPWQTTVHCWTTCLKQADGCNHQATSMFAPDRQQSDVSLMFATIALRYLNKELKLYFFHYDQTSHCKLMYSSIHNLRYFPWYFTKTNKQKKITSERPLLDPVIKCILSPQWLTFGPTGSSCILICDLISCFICR